jgi:hypothetical protein
VPGLGGAWTVDAAADDRTLYSVILEAGLASRRRAGVTNVIAGINQRLVRQAAAESKRRGDQERLSESYFRTWIANASDAFLALTPQWPHLGFE